MNIPSTEILYARFLESMRIRNFSARTIRGYEELGRGFLNFLSERGISDVGAVTAATLSAYQHHLFYLPTLRGTVRMTATINRSVALMRGFFRFLKAEGYLARDPGEGLEYGREPQRLPRNVLTPAEAKRIIEAPDISTSVGYRDRVILEVLYATGIRRNELIHLKPEDVNLEEELLRINGGKGNKDRVVPLGQIACRFLESYIKGIRSELLRGRTSDRLFISMRAQPMCGEIVRWMINKYGRLARVKKHLTCHLWRHTCATHLVQNRANLRHVQEILGHRSLATTERYLALTITDLKQAHRKFHPRERDRTLA